MKVMCPNCNKIVEVIKEEGKDASFCNACGYSFNIEDARNLLIKTYKSIHKRAYSCVYVEMNYEEGYNLYKECLKYRDNDLTSITGMCLAKLYSQTFDELQFKNVIDIINQYEIVLNAEATYVFLWFIADTIKQIGFFIDEVEARLMKDKLIFYKLEYFKYFKEGVLQINELLKFFNESLSLLEEEEYKTYLEQNPKFLDTLNQNIDTFKKYFDANYDVYEVGLINFNEEVVEQKEYQIEAIPDALDMRIIIPQTSYQKKALIFGGVVIGLLAVAAILILIGIFTTNYIFAYVGFIPLVIGGGIIFYQNRKNKKDRK